MKIRSKVKRKTREKKEKKGDVRKSRRTQNIEERRPVYTQKTGRNRQ